MKDKSKISKKKISIKSYPLLIFYEPQSMMEMAPLKELPYSFEELNSLKNRSDVRNFSIFKENTKPIYELDIFINGGFYEFTFSERKLHEVNFEKFIHIFLKMMEKFDYIKGVRFRPKHHQVKVQLWSSEKENDRILKILDKIHEVLHLPFEKKPFFHLFFPEPLPDASDLSVIEMRGKKVNLLRFGLTLTNFFFVKKVWWEIDLLDTFKKYYIPHTNMIDIGANIGSHTLLMSEIISDDSVIFSFEPVYGDIVQRNIIDNNLQDKVCLFTQGLGKKNENITINVMDRMKPNNFGMVSIVKKIENTPIKRIIGVIALDTLGLTNISVMKIDVEGMEKDVLEGARQTILKSLPAIVIEIWPSEMNAFIESDIGRFLKDECKYQLLSLHTASKHDYVMISKKQKMMDYL